jgi:hypothetical protein
MARAHSTTRHKRREEQRVANFKRRRTRVSITDKRNNKSKNKTLRHDPIYCSSSQRQVQQCVAVLIWFDCICWHHDAQRGRGFCLAKQDGEMKRQKMLRVRSLFQSSSHRERRNDQSEQIIGKKRDTAMQESVAVRISDKRSVQIARFLSHQFNRIQVSRHYSHPKRRVAAPVGNIRQRGLAGQQKQTIQTNLSIK